MTSEKPHDDLGVTRELEVDQVCLRFEEALRSGDQPVIEDYVKGQQEPVRTAILRQLLLLEIERKVSPETVEQYFLRFPDDHLLIREVVERGKHSQPAETEPPSAGSGHNSTPSGSSLHGRFTPGQRVAGRYRIVSLLGKGGMGEVYRADDLVLGQSVALKFLPEDFAKDSKRLEYFFGEVRLARQVSHSHVCRVHDIGEVDGQHFISMEFIDGEDLKALLNRIGRLPQDKGVEIATQLCDGLLAAHQKGVIHRDLKPANVMIDGQGQVRITDFGLATLDDVDRDGQSFVGTPAYMSPEQLAQGKTSVQSDIYSLGLVLYELFTGKRFRNQDDTSDTGSKPSEVVGDIDESVEATILSCLELDPRNRPASVDEVARRLPGGDRLAAALAAGETPSPRIVAESGTDSLMSPLHGLLWIMGIVVAVGILAVVQKRTHLIHFAKGLKDPIELAADAREILRHLHPEEPPYSASGLDEPWMQEEDLAKTKKSGFSKHWPALGYWYRESSEVLWSPDYGGDPRGRRTSRVTDRAPRMDEPGMRRVRLGPKGLLREYLSVPVRKLVEEIPSEPIKWSDHFPEEFTGFNWDDLSLAAWQIYVPTGGAPQFWQGNWPDGEPLHVATAYFANRPTYFRIVHPSELDLSTKRYSVNENGVNRLLAMILLVNFVSIFLALRNHRLGRADHVGARRVAGFCFAITFCSGLLHATHVFHGFERAVLLINFAYGLAAAAEIWIFYMALEPLVRKVAPELLISSTRLLQGNLLNSRVGRDCLIGLTLGVVAAILENGSQATTNLQPMHFDPLALCGSAHLLGVILTNTYWCIYGTLAMTVMYAIFKMMAKRKMLAAGLLVVLTLPIFMQGTEQHLSSTLFLLFCGLEAILIVFVHIRFGILAAICAALAKGLGSIPISTDSSDFYFRIGILNVVFLIGLAVASAHVATGGRLLLSEE